MTVVGKGKNLEPARGLLPRMQWHPTPVLLPGESNGQKSLVGCSPWGRKESDTTERLHFHFSLSCIGEGNGNPLLCSCLENLRDGGAWWAAGSGVAPSWTRLTQLSSSSSNRGLLFYLCACSVAQFCLTLCNPMDCSPSGSSVHGIFQARILEWVELSLCTHLLELFLICNIWIPMPIFWLVTKTE